MQLVHLQSHGTSRAIQVLRAESSERTKCYGPSSTILTQICKAASQLRTTWAKSWVPLLPDLWESDWTAALRAWSVALSWSWSRAAGYFDHSCPTLNRRSCYRRK